MIEILEDFKEQLDLISKKQLIEKLNEIRKENSKGMNDGTVLGDRWKRGSVYTCDKIIDLINNL